MSQDSLENMTTAASQESVVVPDPSGEGETTPAVTLVVRVPSYAVLIQRAIKDMNNKNGSSKRSILRHILANHTSIKKENAIEALDRNLKRMLKSGRIIRDFKGGYMMSPRGHMTKIRQRKEESKRKLIERLKKHRRKTLNAAKLRRFSDGTGNKKSRSNASSRKKKMSKKNKAQRRSSGIKQKKRKSRKNDDSD